MAQKLGRSNTPIYGIITGTSTLTPPDLAALSQDVVTMAVADVSTGDILLGVESRGTLSTAYIIGDAYISASSVVTVRFANVHNSTISHSTSITFRWAYLDRT